MPWSSEEAPGILRNPRIWRLVHMQENVNQLFCSFLICQDFHASRTEHHSSEIRVQASPGDKRFGHPKSVLLAETDVRIRLSPYLGCPQFCPSNSHTVSLLNSFTVNNRACHHTMPCRLCSLLLSPTKSSDVQKGVTCRNGRLDPTPVRHRLSKK